MFKDPRVDSIIIILDSLGVSLCKLMESLKDRDEAILKIASNLNVTAENVVNLYNRVSRLEADLGSRLVRIRENLN